MFFLFLIRLKKKLSILLLFYYVLHTYIYIDYVFVYVYFIFSFFHFFICFFTSTSSPYFPEPFLSCFFLTRFYLHLALFPQCVVSAFSILLFRTRPCLIRIVHLFLFESELRPESASLTTTSRMVSTVPIVPSVDQVWLGLIDSAPPMQCNYVVGPWRPRA